jgi:hypothetical protein
VDGAYSALLCRRIYPVVRRGDVSFGIIFADKKRERYPFALQEMSFGKIKDAFRRCERYTSEEVKGIHLRRPKMPSEDAKDALWEIKQIETICRTIYLS